jgi:hypothetical protein
MAIVLTVLEVTDFINQRRVRLSKAVQAIFAHGKNDVQ